MANRKLFTLTLAGAGLVGLGYFMFGDGAPEEEASRAKHLANQVWIERMPRSERDMIGHLSFIKHPRAGRVGVAGRSSQWRHLIEVFFWKLNGNKLEVHMPQDEVRGELQARTWKCKGEAPDPFELCLELSARGRKTVFYSKKEWVIDPKDAQGSLDDLADEEPELAVLFEQARDEIEAAQTAEAPSLESYTVVDTLALP